MAVQHGLHALAAAAAAVVTTGFLAGRWRRTRARRNNGKGAVAARTPWHRTAPAPAGPARVTSVWSACTLRSPT